MFEVVYSNITVSAEEVSDCERMCTRTSCFILDASICCQSLPGETGNTLYIACLSKRMYI